MCLLLIVIFVLDNHYSFVFICCFFFKQKTAYEMRISDWSSDVCSSDLSPDFHFWIHLPPEHLHSLQRAEEPYHPSRRLCDCEQIGRASCRERVCQYV